MNLDEEIMEITKYQGKKYVGTSARTMHARSKEHLDLLNSKSPKSVLFKHLAQEHNDRIDDEAHDLFVMKPVSFHQTNLNRMVTEAILIERSNPDTLMNQKGARDRTK